MKVIQILPELNSGGVERGTLEMGKYLIEQGYESIVISNGGRLVEQLEAEGSRHITLPVHKKRLSSLKQVRVLRRLFEQEKPDILHLRSRLPAWLAYLAWRKMAPATRPRLITTVHGMYSVNAYSKIMTKGEQVICVSESVKKYVLSNYPKLNVADITVIHRGIDPEEYNTNFKPDTDWLEKWQNEFPETKNKRLLTLPGRITRLKGHEDFFKILQQIDDLSFHGVVAGGTHPKKLEYLEEIKKKAREMGIAKRITFTGPRNDLREILSISEITFSLTQQPESFGRTALESLSLGTPVIGYQHGGVGEILDAIFAEGKIQFRDTNSAVSRIKEWTTSKTKPIPSEKIPFTLEKMLANTLKCYLKSLEDTRLASK